MSSMSSTLPYMLLYSQNLCTDIIDILVVTLIFVIHNDVTENNCFNSIVFFVFLLCSYYWYLRSKCYTSGKLKHQLSTNIS